MFKQEYLPNKGNILTLYRKATTTTTKFVNLQNTVIQTIFSIKVCVPEVRVRFLKKSF